MFDCWEMSAIDCKVGAPALIVVKWIISALLLLFCTAECSFEVEVWCSTCEAEPNVSADVYRL